MYCIFLNSFFEGKFFIFFKGILRVMIRLVVVVLLSMLNDISSVFLRLLHELT